MIISHKYRFIFVKTGKTAGTSIEVLLSPICGPADVFTPFSWPEDGHTPRNYRGWFNPTREILSRISVNRGVRGSGVRTTLRDCRSGRMFYAHIHGWKIRDRVSPLTWRRYLKFCVERNPWDKVVSAWHWYNAKLRAGITMEEYLRYCAERIEAGRTGEGLCPLNFASYTDPRSAKVVVDRILRYEHLDADLSATLTELRVPFTSLSVRAKSGFRSDSDYRSFFSESQRLLVGELFRQEIELHGYSF